MTWLNATDAFASLYLRTGFQLRPLTSRHSSATGQHLQLSKSYDHVFFRPSMLSLSAQDKSFLDLVLRTLAYYCQWFGACCGTDAVNGLARSFGDFLIHEDFLQLAEKLTLLEKACHALYCCEAFRPPNLLRFSKELHPWAFSEYLRVVTGCRDGWLQEVSSSCVSIGWQRKRPRIHRFTVL